MLILNLFDVIFAMPLSSGTASNPSLANVDLLSNPSSRMTLTKVSVFIDGAKAKAVLAYKSTLKKPKMGSSQWESASSTTFGASISP